MRILWQYLKKIARQLLGSENMFGYKSTLANQMYLLYCIFGGKIYFTDRVHNQVKYFWCFLNSCLILFSYVVSLTYLWCEEKDDLVLLLFIANLFGFVHLVLLGSPLISYLCSDGIKATIQHIDNIAALIPSSSDPKHILNGPIKHFSLFLISFAVSSLSYIFVCVFDVALFFEEDKVRSYLYYAYPFPFVREYNTVWAFGIITIVTSIVFSLLMIQVWSIFIFIMYWNIVCCGQLKAIGNSLHDRMQKLNVYTDAEVELQREWNKVFEFTLKQAIKEFQNSTRLINYLRTFFETIGSIVIIPAFGYCVALLYIGGSSDMSSMLKVKYLAGCGGCVTTVFIFHLVAQNLTDLVSEVSSAVYFTPWYRSVKVRKTVYISLYQTHSVKEFSTLKVYGLLFNNFSRFLHGLVSYTNVLRKLTNK